MSTPGISRSAVVKKDGQVIGYATGVTAGIDANLIKEYQLSDDKPAIVEAGAKSFPIHIEKMYIDNTYASAVLNGTKINIEVQPKGTGAGKPVITYSNVVLTSWELTLEVDGVVMESVDGEATSITVGTQS